MYNEMQFANMLRLECDASLSSSVGAVRWRLEAPRAVRVTSQAACARRDHVMLTPSDRLAYSYTTYEMDTAGITLMKLGVIPRYRPRMPSRWTISRNTPRIVPSAPCAAFSVKYDKVVVKNCNRANLLILYKKQLMAEKVVGSWWYQLCTSEKPSNSRQKIKFALMFELDWYHPKHYILLFSADRLLN